MVNLINCYTDKRVVSFLLSPFAPAANMFPMCFQVSACVSPSKCLITPDDSYLEKVDRVDGIIVESHRDSVSLLARTISGGMEEIRKAR